METYGTEQTTGAGWDRLGALASGACAVHCAISALLPSAFAAIGLGALLGHEAEWVFTVIAIALAAAAFFYGWRKHKSAKVGVAFMLGISGLLLARLLEENGAWQGAGPGIGASAGAVLILGHMWNLRESRFAESRFAESRCGLPECA